MKRLNYIVQCLETWKEAYPESWYEPSELALTYARELRGLEPVALIAFIHPDHFNDVCDKANGNSSTPLYALGDEK